MFVRAVRALLHPVAHGGPVDATSVLTAERVARTPDERARAGRFVRLVLAVDDAVAQPVRLDALPAGALPLVVVAYFPAIAEEGYWGKWNGTRLVCVLVLASKAAGGCPS